MALPTSICDVWQGWWLIVLPCMLSMLGLQWHSMLSGRPLLGCRLYLAHMAAESAESTPCCIHATHALLLLFCRR